MPVQPEAKPASGDGDEGEDEEVAEGVRVGLCGHGFLFIRACMYDKNVKNFIETRSYAEDANFFGGAWGGLVSFLYADFRRLR